MFAIKISPKHFFVKPKQMILPAVYQKKIQKKRGAFASRFFNLFRQSNYSTVLNASPLAPATIPMLEAENQEAPLKPRVEPSANRTLP